eukprot:scaffold416_cov329-Pavlova_lutheri.AAC.40
MYVDPFALRFLGKKGVGEGTFQWDGLPCVSLPKDPRRGPFAIRVDSFFYATPGSILYRLGGFDSYGGT